MLGSFQSKPDEDGSFLFELLVCERCEICKIKHLDAVLRVWGISPSYSNWFDKIFIVYVLFVHRRGTRIVFYIDIQCVSICEDINNVCSSKTIPYSRCLGRNCPGSEGFYPRVCNGRSLFRLRWHPICLGDHCPRSEGFYLGFCNGRSLLCLRGPCRKEEER